MSEKFDEATQVRNHILNATDAYKTAIKPERARQFSGERAGPGMHYNHSYNRRTEFTAQARLHTSIHTFTSLCWDKWVH